MSQYESQHEVTPDGDLYVGGDLTFIPLAFWKEFEDWYGDKAYRKLPMVEAMWEVAQDECEKIRMNNL